MSDLLPVLQGFEWLIACVIGIVAMALMIAAGNRMSRGDYLGGMLSMVGSIVVALSMYLADIFASGGL